MRAHAFWLCRACRTARLDTLDTTSATGATRNLVCCVTCINLWYVSYSLIYWNIHLNNLFHLTEQIGFVYVRAQTTTLVQASTIACSSSAMLEQTQLDSLDTLVSTRSTRHVSTRQTCRDVTWRAKWIFWTLLYAQKGHSTIVTIDPKATFRCSVFTASLTDADTYTVEQVAGNIFIRREKMKI